MTITFVCFLLLTILCGQSSPYQITQNFQRVIDTAASKVVAKTEWINVIETTFLLGVPTCSSSSSLSYPSSFNISRNYLVFCYDKGALDPWPVIYTKFSQMIVEEIVSQYPALKLTANVTEIDINQLGYFPALQNAVNLGVCDVAVASTHYSDSRGANAHFQCRFYIIMELLILERCLWIQLFWNFKN